MPKSDTWPGESGPDTMKASDSAGCCDSFLGGNSDLSSLEHLSAEEKACLIFLEETIESLDTEEDSRLSSEESDQPGAQKPVSKDKVKINVDRKPTKNVMVPTPFVVACGSEDVVSAGKTVCRSESERVAAQSDRRKCSAGASEDTAAPSKPGDFSSRTAEGLLPRGPLSYDALVHLRRNASTKKTPLCPAVDHTIDLERCCPTPAEGPVLRNQQKSDKSHSGPPAVAPKPQKIPAHIPLKTQSEESHSVQNAAGPQMVRMEALQKLGLLKGQEQESGAGGAPPAPKRQPSPDPAFKGSTADSSRTCSSQQPKEATAERLQVRTQLPAAVEDFTNQHNHKHNAHRTKPRHKRASAAPHAAPGKPADSVGYTVMVVPGMGADRKEALRKLGLLKN